MNDNTRFTVNVLSRHYQREMVLGGPIKTHRKAAEFAVNAYSNRISQILGWRKTRVLVSVVDSSETLWYVVSIADDGSLRMVQERREA